MKMDKRKLGMTLLMMIPLLFIGCGGGSDAPQTTPDASISVFAATNVRVDAGSSTELTAVFENGAGSVDNGVGTVQSGLPVTVTPNATTTYTLTRPSP